MVVWGIKTGIISSSMNRPSVLILDSSDETTYDKTGDVVTSWRNKLNPSDVWTSSGVVNESVNSGMMFNGTNLRFFESTSSYLNSIISSNDTIFTWVLHVETTKFTGTQTILNRENQFSVFLNGSVLGITIEATDETEERSVDVNPTYMSVYKKTTIFIEINKSLSASQENKIYFEDTEATGGTNTNATETNIKSDSGKIYIGSQDNVLTSELFSGRLYELRFYNSLLTIGERERISTELNAKYVVPILMLDSSDATTYDKTGDIVTEWRNRINPSEVWVSHDVINTSTSTGMEFDNSKRYLVSPTTYLNSYMTSTNSKFTWVLSLKPSSFGGVRILIFRPSQFRTFINNNVFNMFIYTVGQQEAFLATVAPTHMTAGVRSNIFIEIDKSKTPPEENKLYVENVMMTPDLNNNTTDTAISVDNNSFFFGIENESAISNFFQGNLYEIRFYDTILSSNKKNQVISELNSKY